MQVWNVILKRNETHVDDDLIIQEDYSCDKVGRSGDVSRRAGTSSLITGDHLRIVTSQQCSNSK